MSTEFGVNGHYQESSHKFDSSVTELIHLMQSTTDRIRERKPDGVRLRVVDMNLTGAFLDAMEERYVIPSKHQSEQLQDGQIIPEIDKAPLNSSRYLGMIICYPMQTRIDFTANPTEIATLPTELQEFFPQMGVAFFKPLEIALVRPYSFEHSEDFGVVLSPRALEGDSVGVILSTDRKCEPSVIGNESSQLRRLHLTQRLTTMRSNDPVDHEYAQLVTSAGFWIAGILNERMNYC